MATKKDIEETKIDMNERIEYELPLDMAHTDDVFVSVNDYTAHIKRGEPVMLPRYVVEVLEQSRKQEMEAIRMQMGLQKDYEAKAKAHNV